MASHSEDWPFDDRGASYGDGLFETVLLRDGAPQLWEAHLARLAKGCQVLAIRLPARAALEQPLAASAKGLQVLKLMLSRGSGGRGYQLPAVSEPRLRWHLAPFVPMTNHWMSGVRIRHCTLRLGIQPALAGIKHLNRLENVLARAEWTTSDVAEGVLCDTEGRLVEATCMNLFWQRHGRLETPRLDRCGVTGTLREALRQRAGLHEVETGSEVLEDAEAVWLGNSVQGLWPVARLDDAQGRELMRWNIGHRHRPLQVEAHALLGYPLFT